MAQTAVEWLKKQLVSQGIYVPFDMYEQAKQMEKEQIIEAWMDIDTEFERKCAEQYYNETYGKE